MIVDGTIWVRSGPFFVKVQRPTIITIKMTC
jgi:hypothetical protein